MMAKRRSTTRPSRNRPPPSTNRLPPSARNRPPPSTVQNHLLAALPPDDYQRIAATFDVIPLTLKEMLYKPGEALRHVYFPGGGFLSVVTILQDGSMVEVATIGREGMLGVAAVMADGPSASAAMVQAEADTCYRMTADAFRREMERRG